MNLELCFYGTTKDIDDCFEHPYVQKRYLEASMIGRRLVPTASLKGSKLSELQVKSSEARSEKAWTDSDLTKEEAWGPSPGLSSPTPSLQNYIIIINIYYHQVSPPPRHRSPSSPSTGRRAPCPAGGTGKKTFQLLPFSFSMPFGLE